MEIHCHREFVYSIEQETTRFNNFGTRTAKTGIVMGKKKRLIFWESLPTLFYENTKNQRRF